MPAWASNFGLYSSIPMPKKNSIEIIDKDLEKICCYVQAILAQRNEDKISVEHQHFFKEELDTAQNFFRPLIEEAPQYLTFQEYWQKLQIDIENIIAEERQDIPLMHLIGLKLIIISDLCQFSCPDKAQKFLHTNIDSCDDIILNIFRKLIESVVLLPPNKSIKEVLLLDPLNSCHLLNQPYLKNTIPFLSKNGLFGFSGFLYALLNKVFIQPYPSVGNNEIHGGKWGSFATYMLFIQIQRESPNDFSNYANQNFVSCMLMAAHDKLHQDRHQCYINRSLPSFKKWYLFIQNTESNHTELALDICALFYVAHEITYPTSSNGICRAISDGFEDYEYYSSHFERKSEKDRRLLALKDIDDYAKALKEIGADIDYSDNEPWTNGPQVRKILQSCVQNITRKIYASEPCQK